MPRKKQETTTSKTTTTTSKKPIKLSQNDIKLNNQAFYVMIGLGILFLAIIALFKWGFLGTIIANTFRLFVGETYDLVLGLLVLFALFLILRGRVYELSWRYLFGGCLVLCALTTVLHFNTFAPQEPLASHIFSETFTVFKSELLLGQVQQNLGGGLLGACFYASFGYLFGSWGTYFLAILLMIAGMILLLGIKLNAIQLFLSQVLSKLGVLIEGVFPSMKQVKTVFSDQNSQEESGYTPAITKKLQEEEAKAKANQKNLTRLFKGKRQLKGLQENLSRDLVEETDRKLAQLTDIPVKAQASQSHRLRTQLTPVLDLDYFDDYDATQERDQEAESNVAETRQEELQANEKPGKTTSLIVSANSRQEPASLQIADKEFSSEKLEAEHETETHLPAHSSINWDQVPVNLVETDDISSERDERSANHWQSQAHVQQELTKDSMAEVIQQVNPSALSPKITAKPNQPYQLPSKQLLTKIPPVDQSEEYERINANIEKLERTFASFGVKAEVVKANLGPSVTKYEIQPAIGVKVSKIVSLSDDIALALAARDVRMEAPIPGKSLIGIEVPNNQVSPVSFWEIIDAALQSKDILEVPLGRDISGTVCLADLSKMPHLLIAGATGSGKSVGMNVIIVSLLMKAKPNEVKFLMIDPKKVELTMYDGIPHLLAPVVTNPRKAAQALNKVVQEMERRYELFAATSVRNIDGYNENVAQYNQENGTAYEVMPKIVVFVDELADLMMVASNEVETAIIRLAQMARAAGIHMIIATQRPSVDVITGIIKANVPSRLAFAVSSGTDSRTILDSNGAEKLLGRGDMLFQPMGKNKPVRVQGAYISDSEVEKITDFVKNQQAAEYDEHMLIDDEANSEAQVSDDEYYLEAVELVRGLDTISISQLQRRFRIGYNRAARLIDDMEAQGIVGPQDGSKPREVLIN